MRRSGGGSWKWDSGREFDSTGVNMSRGERDNAGWVARSYGQAGRYHRDNNVEKGREFTNRDSAVIAPQISGASDVIPKGVRKSLGMT